MTALLTILFSLLMSYVTYRQTGISLASCVIGGVPGGLAQMVLLGEEIPDADDTVVAYQTFRVLVILLIMPVFLKRWLCAKGEGGSIGGR